MNLSAFFSNCSVEDGDSSSSELTSDGELVGVPGPVVAAAPTNGVADPIDDLLTPSHVSAEQQSQRKGDIMSLFSQGTTSKTMGSIKSSMSFDNLYK